MRIPRIVGLVLLAGFSQLLAESHAGVLGELCLPEQNVPCLTQLFHAEKGAREFSALKEELRRRFATKDERVVRATASWLGLISPQLTDSEAADFEQLYLDSNPNGLFSRSARNHVATLRLSQLGPSQRANTYWVAVREGSVDIGGVDPLVRTVALGRAAGEGLTEFEHAIKAHASEINAGEDSIYGGHLDARLLWHLRLRAGAANQRDAERQEATQLAAMNAPAFRALITSDPAFQGIVRITADYVCNAETGYRQNPEACHHMTCLFHKAMSLQTDLSREAANAVPILEGTTPPVEPDWLMRLRAATVGRGLTSQEWAWRCAP